METNNVKEKYISPCVKCVLMECDSICLGASAGKENDLIEEEW